MSEPAKQQMGDGQDNFGQAAGKAAQAAKQASKEAAKQAAAKGAEATANAAASTVKAGVEGGKAVAEIAAGTASGGPWGAIISAAWAMRHTLYKILICICLVLVFLIVMIASLPSIIWDYLISGGDDPAFSTANAASVVVAYDELTDDVTALVDTGYNQALASVETIIQNGGYDYELSMQALINYAQSSAGYDVSYILAAYSASLQQQNTSTADMLSKLGGVTGLMFPVTSVEKELERTVPVTYSTYKAKTVTVVTSVQVNGIVNGVTRYTYTTEQRTYYLPDEVKESETAITVPKYKAVTVTVPTYSNGAISGTKSATYYEADGEETLEPTTEIIKYVECTIHPFDNSVIASAFGVNMFAQYPGATITYGEVTQNMANSLKMTIYGTLGSGTVVPLTDAELIAFVNMQNCNATRKHIITTGLALVGKVPYFWGGKSAAGWNDEWNTPKLVTAAGSSSSGTIRPFGLDCSGFSDWTYKTALGISLQAGTGGQWENSTAITAEELLPGDLGFLMESDGSGWNHVLIFAGYAADGTRMWVHSAGGTGVVFNSPSYEGSLKLRRPKNVDFDQPVGSTAYGEPLYSLQVNVTHYCACKKCCGENAQGITASGKNVQRGMVAMSSYYPFGTQIMINGVMYTVEDRGGSGIENDIGRVDIFVPDHNEALRLGRFDTTAYIYRIGR